MFHEEIYCNQIPQEILKGDFRTFATNFLVIIQIILWNLFIISKWIPPGGQAFLICQQNLEYALEFNLKTNLTFQMLNISHSNIQISYWDISMKVLFKILQRISSNSFSKNFVQILSRNLSKAHQKYFRILEAFWWNSGQSRSQRRTFAWFLG